MPKYIYLILTLTLILFSGCSSSKGQDIQVTKEMNEIITNHIKEHYKNVYHSGDRQFEAHKVYGAKENRGIVSIYIYSVYKEYRKDEPTERSGHSLPALVKLKKDGDTYKVIKYREPEDGSLYANSIKKMFPKEFAKQASLDAGNVPELHEQIDEEVQKWLKEE
ncbi:hypothetical protein [Lysinibacillus boronitolerans]|uniref:hypothetical protein n=1 Tax=Lysinibacillus boronitolerans TaxID=309788 RepID=UPI003853EC22